MKLHQLYLRDFFRSYLQSHLFVVGPSTDYIFGSISQWRKKTSRRVSPQAASTAHDSGDGSSKKQISEFANQFTRTHATDSMIPIQIPPSRSDGSTVVTYRTLYKALRILGRRHLIGDLASKQFEIVVRDNCCAMLGITCEYYGLPDFSCALTLRASNRGCQSPAAICWYSSRAAVKRPCCSSSLA